MLLLLLLLCCFCWSLFFSHFQRKCHQYWPDKQQPYGKVVVTSHKTEVFADFTIRTFIVAHVSSLLRGRLCLFVAVFVLQGSNKDRENKVKFPGTICCERPFQTGYTRGII